MGDLRGLITDPEFEALALDQKREVLSRVDPQFNRLTAEQQAEFITRVRGPDAQRILRQGVAQGIDNLLDLGSVLPFVGKFFASARRNENERREDIAPRTTGQRLAQAAVTGVTESIPTLPLAALGPASGALRVGGRIGLDLLSGANSEVSRVVAEQLGAGPREQFAASLAGGFSPGALLGTAGAIGRRLPAQLGGRALRESKVRRTVGEIVGDRVSDRREAAEALRKEAAEQPFGTQATPTQTLETIAPDLAPLEVSAIRDVPGVGKRLSAVKRANKATLQEKFDALNPEGVVATAQETARENLEVLSGKVKQAFTGIGDVQGVDGSALTATVAELRTKFDEDILKKIASPLARIQKGEFQTTSLRRLENFEQALTQRIRVAVSSKRNVVAKALGDLKTSVASILDDVAEQGNSESILALRRAKDLRRLQGAVFENSSAMKFFMKTDNLEDGILRVVRSGDKQDLDRLRLAVGNDPEAIEGIRQVLRNFVFGPVGFDSFAKKPERVVSLLRSPQTRSIARAYDFFFGPGSAKTAARFAERLRQVQLGRSGNAAALAVKPGSGVAVAGDIIKDAATGSKLRAGALLLRRIGVNDPTGDEIRTMLATVLEDNLTMAALLDELPPQLESLWRRTVRAKINRDVFRASAGVSGGEEE